MTRKILILTLTISALALLLTGCCCPGLPLDQLIPQDGGIPKFGLGKAPKLVISEPPDNAISDVAEIIVSGKTDPKASLTLNGKNIDVTSDGAFNTTFKLYPGENILIFAATKGGSAPAIKRTTVTFESSGSSIDGGG